MLRAIRCTGAIAALLLAVAVTPVAALAESFSLAPAQPSVAAGQTIEFAGAGFTPGERVASWLTAPDQAVLGGEFGIDADADGRVELAFKIPKDAIGGRWAITAYGLLSQTPVIATFDVQGRDPASAGPQAAVAPQSGPPGTRFAFAAFGYRSKELVSYWFTGPDGAVHDAYPEGARTTKSGRVDIGWTAPLDAPRGTWVITIQGLKGNVARGVAFEIR